MKKFIRGSFIGAIALLSSLHSFAQTPADAIMMKQKEICFLLQYDYGQWDQYYEGSWLRSNGNVATLKRSTVMAGAAVGITDDLNLIVAVPFVSTSSSEPNGGKMEGATGFQDASFALKYRLLHKELSAGRLSLLATGGYSTPVTNYLSDYMPYSLGFGADEWSLRAIAQYRWNMGLYFRGSGAYLWRGETEAERDYYYNNGSHYTTTMDVPNAFTYDAVVGIWLLDNALKFEANYRGTRCVSGDDIRKYNAGQPTNKVESDQLGGSVQYYFPTIKGFGVLGYATHVVNGRNTGKFTNFGVGATYQFSF